MAVLYLEKSVDELTRLLQSFKWPTRRHRTATVPIIRNFYLGQDYVKCFFAQSSKQNEMIFNTMFYDNVRLKDPYG